MLKACMAPVKKDFPQYQFRAVGVRVESASPDAGRDMVCINLTR